MLFRSVFDPNQLCSYINNPFLNFSGLSEDVALGKKISDFLDIESQMFSQFNALFTWPRRKEFELILKNAQGESIWTRCLCNPLYEKDQFTGILIQGYNIHKRKMAELALEQNERQYRDLANSGETLVWVADKFHVINYANQLLSDFSKVPVDLIVGSKTPMRYHPKDKERIV